MKSIPIFMIFLLSSIFSPNLNALDNLVQSFDQLKTKFTDPPVDYRSAPLWVWNDRIDRAGIDRQLVSFKNVGIEGVFVHPRPGLITPYLSEDWFSLFRYTVKKGKELGMHIWIYDENSYPSGFAGGRVPADMPESFNQGVALKMHTAETLETDSIDQYELILKQDKNQFINITRETEQYLDRQGKYYMLEKIHFEKSPWHGGYTYVDLLVKGVTEKFLDVTMREGYEKVAGNEFGRTVPGLFTDEPNLARGVPRGAIRWTPDLFNLFAERWGYDLRVHLPSLFYDIGEYARVRHNYYQLLLDLFIERWAKPNYDYCEKHDLKWTGHYWEHGWPSPAHCPDNMAMYAWHQQPGIDMLFNQFNEDEPGAQFGNIRSVKELASAANQMGRTRKLSETYGGGGWDVTFEDLKRLGDWEYVLGVNFLNQHLSYWTCKGIRKYDWPLSFSYHEPWWPHYKHLADYFARLSLALSSGEQINRILVIEPTTSMWMHYSPISSKIPWGFEATDRGATLSENAYAFHRFLKQLERQQVEYDLGSEDIIKDHGSIKSGQFVVGQRAYDLVVFPPGLENVNKETLDLIKAYLKQDGRILTVNANPNFIDGQRTDRFNGLFEKYPQQFIRSETVDNPDVQSVLVNSDIEFFNPTQIPGKLYHHRRILSDGALLFLVNACLDTALNGRVKIRKTHLVQLDLFDGSVMRYPADKTHNGIEFEFQLPPAGSLLLYACDQPIQGKKPSTITKGGKVPAIDDIKVQRTSPNVLMLDYLNLSSQLLNMNNVSFYKAGTQLFKAYGYLTGNPWERAVQFKTDILDKDPLYKDANVTAFYTFTIDESVPVNDMQTFQLVVEQPELWQVCVNDQKVNPLPGKWWLDRDFAVYEIGSLVNTGTNHITLNIKDISVHSELMPIYVLGEFDLSSAEQGWMLQPKSSMQLGSWADQGMPNYFDAVSYRQTFSLDKAKSYCVRLNTWQGTLAEVIVNQKSAGIIAWEPHELNITPWIKNGYNEITVKIYGSLTNLFGPRHEYTAGISPPHSVYNIPDKQPPGKQYHSNDYGLYKPFKLFELE